MKWAGCVLGGLWLAQFGLSASAQSEHVKAAWVSEISSIQPGVPFQLGLQLTHAPHWHTYWKNPGDFGYPTTVDWDLPEGLSAGPIRYAIPQWIEAQGQVSFGYEGTITHLVTITPEKEINVGDTLRIGGRISWLECKEVCIPGGDTQFIHLSVSNQSGVSDEKERATITGAESRLPWAPTDWSAHSEIDGETLVVRIDVSDGVWPEAGTLRFFSEHEGLLDLSRGIQVRKTNTGYVIHATLNPARESTPDSILGLLVSTESWVPGQDRKAVVIDAPLKEPGESVGAAVDSNVSILFAVFAAFLGGIILNLMPCVFPVISLKILGFVNLAGEDPQKVWRHGLYFASGVLVSFWVVAGILLIVKSSVPSVGWGFQLKEPVVVISMCILFFLLALNLFGVFEMGTSLTGIGSGVHAGVGGWNTFFSGVLATLVATPCTGPFMGVAVGAALTQPVSVGMLIFTFLGVGMATPYLLLSRFPGWLQLVPKPGIWMETLKQFLGFLLMGFSMWLVWILNGLRGSEGLSRLLTGLLLIGLAAWMYGRWAGIHRPGRTRILATMFASALFLGGAIVSLSRPSVSPWLEYSPALVNKLKSTGQPFFVDFTADWCLTCQANKRVALNTDRVLAAFKERNVTLIEADWTQQQEEISRGLAEFGRKGVPLYLLYGVGGQNDPIILPQLLTPGIVLRALERLP